MNGDTGPERRQAKIERKLRAAKGIRSVRRPLGPDAFDLTYIRTGPRGGIPLLVVPGGPGMASVRPYAMLRTTAARLGLDVIMVEHRGVGLSRRTAGGAQLPPSAITLDDAADDLAAVLDAEDIPRAVVYGTSYGGYLAQTFGVLHGGRVAGMVLDSTWSEAAEWVRAREHLRALLWHGEDPATAAVAGRLRALVESGRVPLSETGTVVPVAYEFGGIPLLDALLRAVERGRTGTWRWLAGLGASEVREGIPYLMEFDLVGRINFRELYPLRPDDGPLDQAENFRAAAARHPAFVGEPRFLPQFQPEFDWPVAVVSGARDVRLPRPLSVALADRLPDSVLLRLDSLAHSALDNHPRAALYIAGAVASGNLRALPTLAPEIEKLPRPAVRESMPKLIRARIAAESLLPV